MQENVGFGSLLQDLYLVMLRWPPSTFFASICALPFLCAAFFTPFYMLDLGSLLMDDTAVQAFAQHGPGKVSGAGAGVGAGGEVDGGEKAGAVVLKDSGMLTLRQATEGPARALAAAPEPWLNWGTPEALPAPRLLIEGTETAKNPQPSEHHFSQHQLALYQQPLSQAQQPLSPQPMSQLSAQQITQLSPQQITQMSPQQIAQLLLLQQQLSPQPMAQLSPQQITQLLLLRQQLQVDSQEQGVAGRAQEEESETHTLGDVGGGVRDPRVWLQVVAFCLGLQTGLEQMLFPNSFYTIALANINALTAQLLLVFMTGAGKTVLYW